MLSTQLLVALTALALSPSLVNGAIFPKDTTVKMLDAKGWKKAMKQNQTSIVAFVAPWCGHCQRMAPEYSKAALGLYPLIPAYAVDCDDAKNKRLCAEQGVQGFPTVKVFPRGSQLPPIPFEGERTASTFWYYTTRRVPPMNKKLYKPEDIKPWVEETAAKSDKPRALLMYKDKKLPLLWQVLANKYADQIIFTSNRDRKGKSSIKLGMDPGEAKESKVLIYPPGKTQPVRYQGLNKFDSLSKFFDSVLDGTADLSVVNEDLSKEEYTQSPEEKEIEMKQEAQRIALAHGGYSDLIDFEAAMKNGAGANFHDTHGFGSMGDIPLKKKKAEEGGNTEAAPDANAASPAPDAAPPTEPEAKVPEEKAEDPTQEPAPPVAQQDEGAQTVLKPSEASSASSVVAKSSSSAESAVPPKDEL